MTDFSLAFTDKKITPWSGLALLKRLGDRLGFFEHLSEIGLPEPGSNRGYKPEQLITQLLISVWCGANRYEHCEVTRLDETLAGIFGIKRMAGHRAISRLFGKFGQGLCKSVFDRWYSWMFEQLKIGSLTLDLDSTVMTRFGLKQEGAVKGYNPKNPGRNSHHPLLAFVADTQMVANIWLRPGNAHTANNGVAFLENTLSRLGSKNCELLRADSGFAEEPFFKAVEAKGLHYTIALRLNQPLQRALNSIERAWWPLEEEGGQGIELCQFDYKAAAWGQARRVVGIRQHLKTRPTAKGKQLSLFADDEVVGSWRYSAIVTDMDLPALMVWRLYRGRADCENRIKELKYDFGSTGFNQKNFWATEAALATIMMGFNLMSLLRKLLLKKQPLHTLKTLRYKLFGVAGYIVKTGRQKILTMAMNMRRRAWFSGLWEQSKNFDYPVSFAPIFIMPSPP
ncbi:MAG: IS1380 family transposase [Planctomycetes bacterium]|nr:IS1380 family transposase [Planctomycetota bacterium]